MAPVLAFTWRSAKEKRPLCGCTLPSARINSSGIRRSVSLRVRLRYSCSLTVKLALIGSSVDTVVTALLEGPTAVIWSTESPSAPAKIATKVAKEHEKFVIKGGYFDGQALDAAGVKSLATMPGKDELRAQFLMTLLAAPTEFVRLLAAGPTNFLYVLQARERALGDVK